MIKYLLSLLFIFESAFAGLPPTTSKASGDSANVTTFNFLFPNFSVTRSGASTTFGNLSVSALNSGTGATSSTFWRGDGTWGNPTIALTAPLPTQHTSGSGTHTVTGSPLYMIVELCGSGGSGAGGGLTGSNGTAGDSTTFDNLTGGGGGAGTNGNNTGGAGGTATVGAGWTIIDASVGSPGGPGKDGTATGSNGGSGGNSPYYAGAGTSGAIVTTGIGASANSGAGGAGGPGNGQVPGSGGGSGGCVRAMKSSPTGGYSFSVGASKTGGATGTGGQAGSNSAAGKINVIEHYQ